MRHDDDKSGHIMLSPGVGGETRCVACGLCASHCPVQCIRIDWKVERTAGRMDPLGAPVAVHLGKPVLLAPQQAPPPAKLFEKAQGRDPRRAKVHLGTPIPVSRASLPPERHRRRPTLFVLEHRACIRCGKCVGICPVHALAFREGTGPDNLLRRLQRPVQAKDMHDTIGARP